MGANIKFIKMALISKTQNTQESEAPVFQRNRYKIETNKNLFEQKNEHIWIIDKIKFHDTFKQLRQA